MKNKKTMRRKNVRAMLIALLLLFVAIISELVAACLQTSFGIGLTLVGTVGVLLLCILGGTHREEVCENEK